MKKFILSLFAIAMLCSCGKSNEEKAQELIKTDLKETMKDWHSYESVSFSKLDSTFTEYKNLPEAEKIEMEVAKLQAESDSIRILANSSASYNKVLFDQAIEKIRKAKELDSTFNANKENYKGNFNGWQMIHKYRGNNSYGAKDLATTAFYFDTNITKVTDKFSLD